MKYTIICLFLLFPLSLFAQKEADSLKTALSKASELDKIDILNELSEYYRDRDLDLATRYAEQAIDLAERFGKLDKIAIAEINKGVAYRSKGDSKVALEQFLKALVAAEKIQNLPIQADALHKIGVTYLFQKDFYNALKFAEKEEIIWRELKDIAGLASAVNFHGLIYVNLKNYDLALQKLEESLIIARQTKDDDLIYKPLTNIGDLYYRMGNASKAIDYMSQGLKVSEEANNRFGIATSLLNLGKAYMLKKDYDTAKENLKKALEKGMEIQALPTIRNTYSILSEVHEKSGEFKEALFYQKLYKSADDSLINKNVRQSINEMELKYEAKKKEQEIQKITIEKELLETEKEIDLLIKIGLSIVAFLAIIATLSYYRQYKLKQVVNSQLIGVNKEIILKSEEINAQKELIEQINRNLLSSITYARNIQNAIAPKSSELMNSFSGYFIFNQPRDIVSGDFCWFRKIEGQTLIALGDCTGHGVPAALITVLCNSFLQEITEHTHSPASILQQMHQKITQQLYQKDEQSNDGLELAVCSINEDNTQLIYAGAKIPLYLIQNQELKIIKGDHFPIGDAHYNLHRTYTEHLISISKDDIFYLSSDGYQDQFGGRMQKKFLVKNFKNLLFDIHAEPIEKQERILQENFLEWKGKFRQTDDIIVIGVKI
ncbi:MAG: tetratricopeptide repeat protein [Thermoflexibacter sp.]|nr:tetratricopeptide repeat protein [Thermoflexibacter sp.]